MWGGASRKPSENKVKTPMEEDLPAVHFSEADLEDPELLAELQGLIEPTPVRASKKPENTNKIPPVKPKPKSNEDEIEEKVQQALAVLPADDGEVEVHFDEKDMHDPELLVISLSRSIRISSFKDIMTNRKP